MFALRRAPRGTRAPLTIPPIIDRTELAAAFEHGLALVEQRWPAAPVTDPEFAAHVRAHVGTERDLSARLPRLRIEDLFLAWWAMTSSAGIDAFEEELGGDLARIVGCVTARFGDLDAGALMQLVLTRLFVGDQARISEFSGFGSLRAWVEVVVTQTLLDAARPSFSWASPDPSPRATPAAAAAR